MFFVVIFTGKSLEPFMHTTKSGCATLQRNDTVSAQRYKMGPFAKKNYRHKGISS